ncbi:hypothetical protein E4U54_008143 [Claviceps lovelessii]|nr:hypothetical protein E4U54_008143 [Claviceps lovelessii]
MSRFISAGTILPNADAADPPIISPGQHDNGPASSAPPPGKPHMADTSTEWAAVQKELEEGRRARAAQRSRAAEGGERSLYEVLQANKAAKQAAFEEQTKIRNQFRALDEDEIEFLDEVKAAKRMEEERVRREMEEGLKAFREQQRRSGGVGGDGAEGTEGGEDGEAGTEMKSAGGGEWGGTGRKRKRGRERERVGLVRRKTGGEEGEEREGEKDGKMETGRAAAGETNGGKREKSAATADGPEETRTVGTGSKQKSLLVSYGSDDSDDE